MTPDTTPAGSSPRRVLVTDGEFKHTLGIVRRLAARGHEVHVLARSLRAPAIHSRSVRRWHQVAGGGPDAYATRLLEVAAMLDPVSVIAVGSDSVGACDRLRGRWSPGVRVAIPDAATLATANDKVATARLAESLGVRVPRTRVVRSLDDARAATREIGLPMVLKSAREEGRKVLRYVADASALERAMAELGAATTAPLLAQEQVAGDGYGFCALYWNGTLQRAFMHRRVREWPPTGGASACAESVPDAPELERAGRALLDALRWHGVAMVEFKGRPGPGALALIEINAKFWGSLDVALASGVDFPGDLAALMEGRALGPQPAVPRVRFAWPLGGDLWHGLLRPASLPSVAWDALSPAVAHSFRLSDPLPSFFELLQWVRSTPGAFHEARALR